MQCKLACLCCILRQGFIMNYDTLLFQSSLQIDVGKCHGTCVKLLRWVTTLAYKCISLQTSMETFYTTSVEVSWHSRVAAATKDYGNRNTRLQIYGNSLPHKLFQLSLACNRFINHYTKAFKVKRSSWAKLRSRTHSLAKLTKRKKKNHAVVLVL